MKTIFLVLAACLAMGCSALVQKNENGYPVAVVENIINSCNNDDKNKQFCVCLSKKIQKSYTYKEFADIDKAIADGNQPEEFTKFSLEAGHECGSVAPKNESGYPDKVVENFVRECEKSGSDIESCKCFSEKIQAKYTYQEFAEIEKDLLAGEPNEEFLKSLNKIRQECADHAKK